MCHGHGVSCKALFDGLEELNAIGLGSMLVGSHAALHACCDISMCTVDHPEGADHIISSVEPRPISSRSNLMFRGALLLFIGLFQEVSIPAVSALSSPEGCT